MLDEFVAIVGCHLPTLRLTGPVAWQVELQDDRVMHDAVCQFTGLSDVVCLAPSERESQWIARSVGAYLHLRAEISLDFSEEPEAFVPLSPRCMFGFQK